MNWKEFHVGLLVHPFKWKFFIMDEYEGYAVTIGPITIFTEWNP